MPGWTAGVGEAVELREAEDETRHAAQRRRPSSPVTPWEVVQGFTVTLCLSDDEDDDGLDEEDVGHDTVANEPSVLATLSSSSYNVESTFAQQNSDDLSYVEELRLRAKGLLNALEDINLSEAASAAAQEVRLLILERINDFGFQRDWSAFEALQDDFISAATSYGKLIISENSIPNRYKTLKEAHLGGLISGAKFVHHGLLFKLAPDGKLSKGASHELASLRCLRQDVPGLQTPMFCVIHYKGLTISAQSVVPIGRDTLIHGSHDMGVTVLRDDAIEELLESTIGKKYGIATHLVGQKLVSICGPWDGEIHRAGDGLLYAIDFHRLSPATSESHNLERLFRFEFLCWYAEQHKSAPLSSDSYSPLAAPSEVPRFTARIRAAAKLLLEIRVPALAQNLSSQGFPLFGAQLVDRLHEFGVNVRLLPLVAKYIDGSQRVAVIQEIVARILKHEIWNAQRAITSPLASPSRHVAEGVAVLNLAMTGDDEFWRRLLSRQRVFDSSESWALPSLVEIKLAASGVDIMVIVRTCQLAGLGPRGGFECFQRRPLQSIDFECVARVKKL